MARRLDNPLVFSMGRRFFQLAGRLRLASRDHRKAHADRQPLFSGASGFVRGFFIEREAIPCTSRRSGRYDEVWDEVWDDEVCDEA